VTENEENVVEKPKENVTEKVETIEQKVPEKEVKDETLTLKELETPK